MSTANYASGNSKVLPGGDDIKSCYLRVFEEKTEFSLTVSSCLSAFCLMILLVVCTSYIRALLIKHLKEAITSNSLSDGGENSAKSLTRTKSLTQKLVLNSEKLERSVLALLLIFFPSADPASNARLKVKNNPKIRVGRRSVVGDMLLEEVHKETYLLGAYGYQDVFNFSLVAMLLVSHAHFPTSVVILLVKILLSSISCRLLLPIVRATDSLAIQFSLISQEKLHDGFRYFSSCVSICLSFILLTIFLHIWGFDTTNIFAGLGIGGLAVGLALQTTLKDVFASIILMADRPFKTGDYVNVSGGKYAWSSNKAFDGVIENVGLRSTTVCMNQSGQILHIPNSDLASSRIVNQSEMKRRRHDVTIVLDASNSIEKMRLMGKIFAEASNTIEGLQFEEFAFLQMVHNSNSNCYGHNFSAVYFVEGNDTKFWKKCITELHFVLLEKIEARGLKMANAIKYNGNLH